MSDDEPITLYPFRLRNPLTGKWHRARWKASAEEIAAMNGEWIIDGPPVVYRTLGATSNFQPWGPRPAPSARLELHPQRSSPPAIDPEGRFLALTFLRRYVTYCTRRRRYSSAQGAAILYRELTNCR